MQKTFRLILMPALLLCLNAQGQRKAPALRFPFEGYETSLSPEQGRLADSLYQRLGEGDKLRLVLLTAAEEGQERETIARISYQRASMLLQHFRRAKVPAEDFCAEIVPFQMPNVVRTNDLTRASSVSVAQKSQTHILLSKTLIRATSEPSVEFDADFSKELQEFAFNTNDGINTTLASGTQIFIPANSLQQANGLAPECTQVTLRVSEYLDLEAVAMKAMTTTSSGKKLQTAGMWYIDVVCNGKPLVMKPGIRYSITVSMTGEPKDMRVFTGRVKNGLLDWKEETDDKVMRPAGEVEQAQDEENFDSNLRDEVGERYSNEIFNVSNAYSLQLNDFGWINCDAFDREKGVTNLMVYGEVSDSTNVMLVYGKRKSVLPGYLCEDKKSVKFSDISTDETAMLVVFRKTDKKGGVEKYTRIIQPGKQDSITVDLTASTAEDLRLEIKGKLSDL